jgi:GNAT superfamily N-acetyltransferase
MGAEVLHEPPLLATRVPFAPNNNQMNGAHCVADVEQFNRAREFYGDQSFWIDVTPSTSPEVLALLGPAGFRPDSFTSVLGANPLPSPNEHEIDVATIHRDELNTFLDTINSGFGTPAEVLPALRSNQAFWCDVASWRLILARVDGEPAGAAVVSIHSETAYLSAAATLPKFRRAGVHAALISERLRLAGEAGCTAVTGQAEAGSTSQGNQQRAGLSIAHTKCIWTNHRGNSS